MSHKSAAKKPNFALRFVVLIVLFFVVALVSLWLGKYSDISILDVPKILLNATGLCNFAQTWGDGAYSSVVNVRLPRVLAAILIGAALSVAGASYQGMFRNPMVSPDILGATNGAGFGAALAILLGMGWFGITIQAFIFGLAAVLIAYGISRFSRVNPILSMVLAGMVISSLFGSAISFIKLIADTEEQLPAITYWLMGSLASTQLKSVAYACIPVFIGLVPLIILRWRMNLLTAGEDEARAMGINTNLLRGIVIACATLMTTACVAISGVIGWVGLVIPHFCRMIYGSDFRKIIPAAIFMGAAFLLVADDFARMITTSEIPIGILTSFVGAPVFVYLIITGGLRRES